MKTKQDIFLEVQKIMMQTFKLSADEVTLEKNIYTDLDLDSLDAIDLAVEMSKRVGQKFDNEQLRSIRTISDIVDAIAVKLNID